MPLFSTDCVVSREVQPLLDMGWGENWGDRVARSTTKSDVVSSMMALRWVEGNVMNDRES